MTDQQWKKYEEDVYKYRSIGMQKVTIIISFAVGIFGLGILQGSNFEIIEREFTARILWFFSIAFIFTSILTGLRSLFLLTRGYYRQSNAGINNFQGDPVQAFSSADKYINFTYMTFTIGLIIAFFVFVIDYFS